MNVTIMIWDNKIDINRDGTVYIIALNDICNQICKSNKSIYKILTAEQIYDLIILEKSIDISEDFLINNFT